MPVAKFALFQAFVLLPFVFGQIFRGQLRHRASHLVRFNLIFLEPWVVFWSTWGLQLAADRAALPVAGFLMVGTGFVLGRWTTARSAENQAAAQHEGTSPALRAERADRRRAAYNISASLSNHGFTMGGFVCYLLYGEVGLGYSALFVFYFTPYLFLVMFPYARRAARSTPGEDRLNLLSFLRSWNHLPLYAAVAALALLFAGIERPAYDIQLEYILLPSVGLYYCTLGLSFDARSFGANLRDVAVLSVLKFLLTPALTFAVLLVFTQPWGLPVLSNEIAGVIAVMAFMPAAVYSVMTAVLFDLESAYASELFVGTTAVFLFLVLPLIFLCKDLLIFS